MQTISGVVQANPTQTIVPQNKFVGPIAPQPTVKVVQPAPKTIIGSVVQAQPKQTISGVVSAQPKQEIRPENIISPIFSMYKALDAGAAPLDILREINNQNLKTKPQLSKSIQTALSQGADPQMVLNEIFKQNGYKNQQEFNAAKVQQNQPKEPGMVQKFAQGVASPFLRTGLTLARAAGAVSYIASGDREKAATLLDRSQPTNLGYFGDVKPVGLANFNEGGKAVAKSALDTVGVGTELASYAIGGEGTSGLVKAGFKGIVKEGILQGAKTGLQVGALQGLGSGLQKEDATLGSVAKDTFVGGLGGALTGGALGGVTSGISAGVRGVANKFSQNFSKQADEAIVNGIERGIKPSVAGKKTPTLYNNFLDRSKLAVKYITETKNELGLKKLPKTMDEFSDAISKAKTNVFAKYNYLNKVAGQGEARVYLQPVVNELSNIAKDPVLSDVAPQVSKYAQDLAETYTKRGFYTTEEAQKAIELFNSKLKAYYRNPSPELANKVYMENMVVNNLRKELDSTIQNASGQNYQALKNVYGALSDLEKEVSHRAVVVNRQNVKGLADLSDIYTGSQMIEGLLTGNPLQITRGLVGKTIATTYKTLNNPDRIIQQMFDKVDAISQKANSKGTALTERPTLKTMLSLPGASNGTPRGTQPTINLDTINQPSRVVTNGNDFIPRTEVNPSRMLPAPSGTATGDFTQTINLPSKVRNLEEGKLTRIGGKGSKRSINSTLLQKGQMSSPSILGQIKEGIQESTPGLYTTSKYHIEYTNKAGKKITLKNLSRGDATGWATFLKEKGIKYTVKTVGSTLSALGIAKTLNKKH